MTRLDRLALAMAEYDAGVPQRIQHFLKVHAFARLIGLGEGLDGAAQLTLEAAAYVHDIGIKPAEEKYGRSDGPLQEREGPGPARRLLTGLGFPADVVGRVCYLVGRHHTYDAIDGPDYQILVEADFLVNLFEGGADPGTIRETYARIFRTGTGRTLCRTLFGIPEPPEKGLHPEEKII